MLAPLFWHDKNVVSTLLLPLSWLYYGISLLRRALYRPRKLSVPVICVGNVTAGGSGKTPSVMAIVAQLKAQGHTPHIISRGYKGNYNQTFLRVDPDRHSAEEVGDEPLLLAAHAPCWVGGKRRITAQAAIKAGATIIVMDDGLQNPSLHKDISFIIIDGGYGIGNARILPAGPCREPLSAAVKRAQAAIIIGDDTTQIAAKITRKLPIVKATITPRKMPELRATKLYAFAGIGRPEKFFDTLRETLKNTQTHIIQTRNFPDHHSYTHQDAEQLLAEAHTQSAQLITTEKDHVRLPALLKQQTMSFPITLKFENASEIQALLPPNYTPTSK